VTFRVQGRDPNNFRACYFENASLDRNSVLTGHHLPPQPYIKAVKKFTWQIYALSERLLVCMFDYMVHTSDDDDDDDDLRRFYRIYCGTLTTTMEYQAD